MHYRLTRLWARLLVVVGVLFVALGVLLAAVALVIETPWRTITGQAALERIVVAIVVAGSGIFAGAPFIVAGQLLLVSLAQRRLLLGIYRRLGRARDKRKATRDNGPV